MSAEAPTRGWGRDGLGEGGRAWKDCRSWCWAMCMHRGHQAPESVMYKGVILRLGAVSSKKTVHWRIGGRLSFILVLGVHCIAYPLCQSPSSWLEVPFDLRPSGCQPPCFFPCTTYCRISICFFLTRAILSLADDLPESLSAARRIPTGGLRTLERAQAGRLPLQPRVRANMSTCLLYTSPSPRDGLLS
eukprot:6204707-Pleurochrysis_carterae.AAC.1